MKKELVRNFHEYRAAFLAALSFLTRLPLPGFMHRRAESEDAAEDFSRSVFWFPAVGLILGVLLALADMLLRMIFPLPLAAALLLFLYILMTGGLHLDGLMDSADGLLSGRSPEKIREIMRDSSSGAFAVLAAILYIVIKLMCFWVLLSQWRAGAFIFMAMISRLLLSLGLLHYPIVSDSLARVFSRELTPGKILALISLPLLTTFLLLFLSYITLPAVLLAAVISLIAIFLISRKVINMLDGLTGDVFGLLNETVELIILLAIIALQ